MRDYQVVHCNECGNPLHVRSAGMQVPDRFIVACKCGHVYEYFSDQIKLQPMEFKPIRDLPRESKDGDLERLLAKE